MALIIYPSNGWDSYISLDDADAYHVSMGNAGWVGSDSVKEAALRKATQYIRITYAPLPEYLDPVHENIKAATAEAALRALSADLLADVDASVATEETIGPITVKYQQSNASGQKRYALIDRLMAGLGSVSSGVSVKLYRV